MIEDGIQNMEKVQVSINITLQLMKNLTSSTNEISAGDLSASLDVLEKIVTVTNITGSSIEKEVSSLSFISPSLRFFFKIWVDCIKHNRKISPTCRKKIRLINEYHC